MRGLTSSLTSKGRGRRNNTMSTNNQLQMFGMLWVITGLQIVTLGHNIVAIVAFVLAILFTLIGIFGTFK